MLDCPSLSVRSMIYNTFIDTLSIADKKLWLHHGPDTARLARLRDQWLRYLVLSADEMMKLLNGQAQAQAIEDAKRALEDAKVAERDGKHDARQAKLTAKAKRNAADLAAHKAREEERKSACFLRMYDEPCDWNTAWDNEVKDAGALNPRRRKRRRTLALEPPAATTDEESSSDEADRTAVATALLALTGPTNDATTSNPTNPTTATTEVIVLSDDDETAE
jgi:hypothetical protein